MEGVSSGILCLPRVWGKFIVTAPDHTFENFLLADRFEGGCILMVLMRTNNRQHYCLGRSVESKMDVHICIGLVN